MHALTSLRVSQLSAIDSSVRDFLQFPLFGKLAAEDVKIIDDLTAGLYNGFLWSDGAVCTDAHEHVWFIWVRDLIAREEDLATETVESAVDEIAESVVLFGKAKDGHIGHACFA